MSLSKVVVVTGTTKGIGLEIARHLLSLNHCVVGIGRSDSAISHSNYKHLKLDLTLNVSTIIRDEALQHFGRIDSFIHNAAVLVLDRIENIEMGKLKDSMQINLFAAIEITQKLLPNIRKSRGSVVLISSGAAVQGYKAYPINAGMDFLLYFKGSIKYVLLYSRC
jgi:NAD(P)-dependent dehydrogenase (short-subunit alcohol dehydrogenase family)